MFECFLKDKKYSGDSVIVTLFCFLEKINLMTKNVEFYYLASILIYFHGIYQYHYLLKKISLMENKEEIKFLISEIKDIKFKSSLIEDIKTLE
jgi:hypothetical protein